MGRGMGMVGIWRGLGIRGQLLIAFLAISSFSLIIAAAAFVSLGRINSYFDRIQDQQDPVEPALLLSRELSDIHAAIPQIRRVMDNPGARDDLVEKLRASEARVRALVESEAIRIEAADLAVLTSQVNIILANTAKLERSGRRRAEVREQRETLLKEASSIQDQLETRLAKLNDRADVEYRAAKSPATTVDAKWQRRLDDALAHVRRLDHLGSKLTDAHIALLRILRISDLKEIDEVTAEGWEKSKEAADLVAGLPPALTRDIAPLIHRWAEIARPEGLPAVRRQEVELWAADRQMSAENSAALIAANAILNRLVGGLVAEVKSTRVKAAEVRQVSFVVLGTLALLAIAASLAIVWRYVDRRLLTGIAGVNHWMLQLAKGDVSENRSALTREDEVGAIARCVEEFRLALIERVRLERKLEVANDWLEQEVEARTADLRHATNRLEAANRLLTDSITSARHIQMALLPPAGALEDLAREHAVLWEPREQIGGDYYWFEPSNRGYVVVVIDCTGHGVSGALLTFVVALVLFRLLQEMAHDDPAALLAELHRLVRITLGQDKSSATSDEGFDAALCYVDLQDKTLTYAGARIPLTFVADGHWNEIKGDRVSIGYRTAAPELRLTNHHVALQPGMRFYLATDGLPDQIGGDRRSSFGRARLRDLILRLQPHTLAQQIAHIRHALDDFQGQQVRRDDVTLLAFAPI